MLFKGILYRNLFNYTKVNTRQDFKITNASLKAEIEANIKDKDLSLKEIIDLSRNITNKNLQFTFKNTSSNPNICYNNKRANCIGYSGLYNVIGNYIVNQQHKTAKYEFKHHEGKIDLLGFNIHKLCNSSFFKTHDYNEIIDKIEDKHYYLDPSLNDYFGITLVTSK